MKNSRIIFAFALMSLFIAPLGYAQDTRREDANRQNEAADDALDQQHPNRTDQSRSAQASENSLTALDQQFINEALDSGRKEVATAQLAKQKASNEEVRELAQVIEQDHTKLNSRLEQLGTQASTGTAENKMSANNNALVNPTNSTTTSLTSDSPGNDTTSVSSHANKTPSPNTNSSNQNSNSTNRSSAAASNTNKNESMRQVKERNIPDDMQQLQTLTGEDFDRAYVQMQVDKHRDSIAKFEAVSKDQSRNQAVRTLARDALVDLRKHANMAQSLHGSLTGTNLLEQSER